MPLRREKGKCQRCKKVRPLSNGEMNYGLCYSCATYETKRRRNEREDAMEGGAK